MAGEHVLIIEDDTDTNRFLKDLLKREAFRSSIAEDGKEGLRIAKSLQPDIILLDTIGELSGIYSKAAITFVGGSLIAHGGHNILEPAYWSKPVLFGPHMDNFPFVEQFLREGAGLMVKDSEEIASTLGYLLDNPAKAAEIGVRAKKITDSNAGAVRKAVELIRGVLVNT